MFGSLGTYYKNVGGLTPSRFVSSDSVGNLEEKTAAEVCTLLGLGPSFSLSPVASEVYEGQTNSFTSTAAAIVGTVTYQWYRQALGVGSFAAISGATSSGYTTPTVTVAANNGDKYRCVASNGLTSITSSEATLTVLAVPVYRYGPSVPITKATQTSVNVTFVPYLPSYQNGTLTQFSAFFITSGNFKIAVLRKNGYTWDRAYLSANIAAASGLNTYTSSTFGTVNIEAGDVVGFIGAVGRVAYTDNDGFGAGSMSMSGEPAASGNVLTYGSGTRNMQMHYTVTGVVPTPSHTIFSETFGHSGIPWGWEHQAGAWSYDGTKATSGTIGHANSLNFRDSIGNLSEWTWSVDFTLDTADAQFAMLTRNAIQNTGGFLIDLYSPTGLILIYRTTGENGWTNGGGTSLLVSQSTGLSFATATTYRMTIVKSWRSASVTITDVATPANTYTLSWDQEDSNTTPTYGFGYGKPGVASLGGTVSVLSTTFTVPTARPDWMFVGDSITEGSGLSSTTLTQARLLATDLAATVVTSAQGGASTLHAPRRLSSEISHIFPKNVCFLLGTNDTVVADWKAKLAGMRDYLTGICDSVVIGAIPAEASDANPETEFNPYILAQGWTTVRNDLALTSPATGLGADRNAALYADTLHPNAAGHSAMRDRFRSDLGV